MHGEAEVVTADEIGQVRRRILAEAMGPVVPRQPLPEHELAGGAGPHRSWCLICWYGVPVAIPFVPCGVNGRDRRR